jgi:hypothetical protein
VPSVTRIRVELLPRSALLAIAASYASPHVAETTRLILNRARVMAPVRTGNLRALLGMKMQVSPHFVTGTVESKAKYSIFVHDATSPHVIRAKGAGFLRFEAPAGTVHFRRMVFHPGTRGVPFLREPMKQIGTARGYRTTGYSAGSKIGFGLSG